MSWINRYAQGTFPLYAGNQLAAFQPIDFFHFYPLFFDILAIKLAGIIIDNDLMNKSYVALKSYLSVPSHMRFMPKINFIGIKRICDGTERYDFSAT